MKAITVALLLAATAAWSDQATLSVVPVGLSLQQRSLLSLTEGARTRQVYVTIDSDQPTVELQRIAGVSTGYVGGRAATVITTERICRAPCQELVDVNDVTDFFIAGDGVTPSGKLDLALYGDSVNIKVKAGSSGRRVGGIMSLAGGLGLMVAGGLLGGLFALMPSSGSTSDLTNGFMVGGFITAGVGLVLTVLGIILLPGSGTDVAVAQGGPVPLQPSTVPVSGPSSI